MILTPRSRVAQAQPLCSPSCSLCSMHMRPPLLGEQGHVLHLHMLSTSQLSSKTQVNDDGQRCISVQASYPSKMEANERSFQLNES